MEGDRFWRNRDVTAGRSPQCFKLLQKRNLVRSLASYNMILPEIYQSQIRAHIEKNPEDATRLVGVNERQLMSLIARVSNLHNCHLEIQEINTTRIIKGGGCQSCKLAIADQILLTLVYLHHLSCSAFKPLTIQVRCVIREHLLYMGNAY
ncbi:hypothetical protein QUA56_27215 [Microcoleus sp. N3A4]|uniref:hypothetical protein n=1 Tax=Microcoleus sp. N3A4 TaxID=3055379 RepID=UPI002FCF5F97